MAEQILPPDLMAILARAGMLGPGAGPGPQQQPQPMPGGSPDLMTLAALARAGMLGPGAMGGQAQPMPPTLGGAENMPPSPMPQQGAPPQQQPMPPTLSGAENRAPLNIGAFLRANAPAPQAAGPAPLRTEPMPPTLGNPPAPPRPFPNEPLPPSMAEYLRSATAPPTTGIALGPQSEAERADIERQREGAVNMAQMAATTLPAGRVASMGGQALMTAARAAPRTTAATLAAVGLTAAPSQAEPPDAMSVARDTIARLRSSQADLAAEQTRLRNEAKQFDNINLKDSEAVKKAQQAAGTKPDGIWSDKTTAAIEAYRTRKNKEADAIDRRLGTLGRDLETQQQRLTGLEGGERLREAERSASPLSAMLRGYGEFAGTGLGIGLGALGRWGLTRHANSAAAERAGNIEAMLERRMTAVPPRTGRLNEVWRQGGAGDRPPFVSTPNTRYGVQTNANAASTSELFPTPSGIRGQVRGADLASIGAAGVDIGVAEYRLHHAQGELAAAQAAAERDPSDLNISRLQGARDEVAFWQSLSRVGQAGIVGYGGAATKIHRDYPRPDLSRADAELANLNRLISPPKPARQRKK